MTSRVPARSEPPVFARSLRITTSKRDAPLRGYGHSASLTQMASWGGTVLVVEDEPSLRLLCRVNLELEGFRVLEAATLDEARALLESEHVDVVVLDVHLGSGDGRDLLDELRAAESATRVVMLTGSVEPTEGRFAAADRVITKPYEPVRLVATVRELVDRAHVDSTT